MRHILLVLIFCVAIFAEDKQIVIGSYVNENNAANVVKNLTLQVENDAKLKGLIEKNSLKYEYRKIKSYYAITVSPLNNYVQLLRTLKSLKKYYPDAYVLGISENIPMPKVETPAPVEKVEKPKQAIIVEEKIVIKEPKIVKKVEVKKEIKKDDSMQNYYYLLIVFVVALLIIIIFKRKKDKQEE